MARATQLKQLPGMEKTRNGGLLRVHALRIRALVRGARLCIHIFRGLALAVIYPALGQATQMSILRRWSQTVLDILDVRLDVQGVEQLREEGSGLIVANHISWLDVFALNAVRPARFVAKSEVRGWPLIGTLCIRAGVIFISRSKRADTLRANRAIMDRIARGEWVVLFPEGTSTDGSDVAPFHASLFQSAIDGAHVVAPVAIHYHDGRGNHTRDAAFIGDMTFLESLINVLLSEALHVTLVFLPAMDSAGCTRAGAADAARSSIRGVIAQRNNHGVITI